MLPPRFLTWSGTEEQRKGIVPPLLFSPEANRKTRRGSPLAFIWDHIRWRCTCAVIVPSLFVFVLFFFLTQTEAQACDVCITHTQLHGRTGARSDWSSFMHRHVLIKNKLMLSSQSFRRKNPGADCLLIHVACVACGCHVTKPVSRL